VLHLQISKLMLVHVLLQVKMVHATITLPGFHRTNQSAALLHPRIGKIIEIHLHSRLQLAPLSLSLSSETVSEPRGKNCCVKSWGRDTCKRRNSHGQFFLVVFFWVTHYGLSQRGTSHSLHAQWASKFQFSLAPT